MKIAIIFTNKTGVRGTVNERSVDQVREVFPDAEIYLTENPAELEEKGIWADAVICWATFGGHFIAQDYCMKNPNLKWIHSLSAGVEAITFSPLAEKPGLRITSSSGIHGIPIAEHVMGFMLNFARKLPQLTENQKQHLWERPYPDELYEKTVCIIGTGRIGAMIAKRCQAFDMRVIGVRRSGAPVENFDQVFRNEDLQPALSQADYVVMAVPQTPDSMGMMNEDCFAAMKPTAYFINIGRGATVDQKALIAALQRGTIAGAALDTVAPEPLEVDSPLWDLPNVMISPHMSAETPKYMERAFAVFQRCAEGWKKGKAMETEVSLSTRY